MFALLRREELPPILCSYARFILSHLIVFKAGWTALRVRVEQPHVLRVEQPHMLRVEQPHVLIRITQLDSNQNQAAVIYESIKLFCSLEMHSRNPHCKHNYFIVSHCI